MKPPYKTPYTITQKYAQNLNGYYASKGLKGHGAWDMVGAHKTPIIAVADSYCYAYINKDHHDLTRYRAVYTLYNINGSWYEVSYGHLMDITAKIGPLKQGDEIGTQGNTGNVFVGGVAPTPAQREKGAGSHLHFQIRAVKPVSKRDSKKRYLTDANGVLNYNNYFWEILNFDNGYNGCIDPEPFFIDDTREEVISAVKKFQNKNGLVADGVVGPKTYEKLYGKRYYPN